MNDGFLKEGENAEHSLDFFHVPGTKLGVCLF